MPTVTVSALLKDVMPDPIDQPLTSAEQTGESLEAATTVAPSLLHSPATAVNVAANGGDLEATGQATSHAQQISAIAGVAKKQSDGGFFGAIDSLGHDVGHAAADVGKGVMNVINAPMQIAQHSFRYLVATEQQHGWGAALGEGLAMVAGAAAVGALTGGFGDLGLEALGAEADSTFSLADAAGSALRAGKVARAGFFTGGQVAGLATGQVANHDLWEKTGSSTWTDAHGHEVSFGRVIAGMMGLRSGGYRTAVSGVLDGVFDMANGNLPFMQEVGAAKGLDGGTGIFSKLGGYAMTTDHLDQMIEHPSTYTPFHRAAQWMADHTSGEIGSQFPRLVAAGKVPPAAKAVVDSAGKLAPAFSIGGAAAGFSVDAAGNLTEDAAKRYADGFISELGDAKTKDEVFQVLRRYIHVPELMDGSRAPTMSLFHAPLAQLRTWAENAESKWTLPDLNNAIQGGAGHFKAVDQLDENGEKVGTQLVGHKVPFKGIRRVMAPLVSSISPAQWARRLHHMPGMQLDPKTLRPHASAVDLVTNRLPTELMDVLNVTQGRKYAEHFGDVWLHADPRTRSLMNSRGQMSALFGMIGHKLELGEDANLATLNDPETRQYLLRRMDELSGNFEPDTSGRYGAYRSGKALQPVVDANGRSIGAGVLLAQHGNATLMDMSQLKRMAGELRAGKDLYGSFDDWMYRHATGPLFKRWVLISGGYMSRIAAAEDIPNMLRLGVKNMVEGGLASIYAKYGWEKAQGEELNAVQHAVYDLIGHLPMTQDKVDAATEIYMMGNGNGLSDAVSAGHGMSSIDDPMDRTENGLRNLAARGKPVRFGKEYQMYGPNDRWHIRQWRVWIAQLRKDPMSSAAAQAMHNTYTAGGDIHAATRAGEAAFKQEIDKLNPTIKARFLASQYRREGDPGTWSAEESWAHHGVQNLIAATHTPEEVPEAGAHMGILHSVADRTDQLPTIRYLKQIEEPRRPAGVPGREVLPDGEGTPAAIATKAFKFMNGFVNLTSRHELFFNEYFKQRQILMQDVDKGLLRHDQAMTVAYSRASQEATRWIHNLHDRTMWTDTMRNWSPFWFAKEQAYRRMGRLLAADPAAFRQYELMIMGAHTLTTQYTDPQNNPYIVLPGEGFLTDTMSDVFSHLGLPIGKINPVELGGDFSSTSVVFPTSNLGGEGEGFWGIGPDFGPVAVVPAKLAYGAVSAAARKYSAFSKPAGVVQNLTQGAFGQEAINEGLIDDILPNTALQRTVQALQANGSTFDTAMMLTMQTMDYDQQVAMTKWVNGGRKGPRPNIVPATDASPQEMQAFLSRLKNQTQMNLMARAILSIGTPVTLEMAYQNYGIPQAIQDEITKAGSVTAGMTEYLSKNPDATPYTVSESTHPNSLASLPESAQAQQWLEDNSTLMAKYPEAAIWLMPQALTKDPYSQTAYNEQIADGLRIKDTPEQFLTALYTAAGDQTYYAAYSEHKAALTAAGQDSTALDAEYNKWDTYVDALAKQQPTWFANTSLFSPDKEIQAQNTVTQLTNIIASGQAPDNSQTTLVKGLLSSYQAASQAMVNANQQYDYTSAVSKVREQWAAYLSSMKVQYPQVAPLISSVFSGLLYFNPAQ